LLIKKTIAFDERTIAKTFRFFNQLIYVRPLAAMLVVFFYALKNFFNFFQKIGWSKTPLNLHMVSKG